MTCCCSCISIPVAVVLGGIAIYWFLKKKDGQKNPELHRKSYEQNKVYLYQFGRTRTSPNPSPYCIKVETFLRANKIKYETNETLLGRSKYGKLPFIELNGQQIADSQLIIDHLKKHFKIKDDLSPREAAIGKAVAGLFDNHTFYIFYKYKMLSGHAGDFAKAIVDSLDLAPATDVSIVRSLVDTLLPPIFAHSLKSGAKSRVTAVLGNFTEEEFEQLLRKDLDTARDILGDKKFFCGEKISHADYSVFGHLGGLVCMPVNCLAKRVIVNEYPTLHAYAKRIIKEYYPEYADKQ